MQWVLLLIHNKVRNWTTVVSLLIVLKKKWVQYVCEPVETQSCTIRWEKWSHKVVGMRWDDVGILSLRPLYWIAPSTSMFSCSSVHCIRCNPFDKKINFTVKPNCFTAYPFMSPILGYSSTCSSNNIEVFVC